MLLKEYTTNKKAQAFVKFLCGKYASGSKLHADDILSHTNEVLCRQILKNLELKDEKHFFNTLRLIALNSAKDLALKNYNRFEKAEAPELLPEPSSFSSVDHEARDLFKLIDKAIRKKFSAYPNVIIAYEQCILLGNKMDAVSTEFKISLGTIKTNMRMVRSFANQQRLKFN